MQLLANHPSVDSIKALVRDNPSQAVVVIDEWLFKTNSDSIKHHLYKEKGYAYQNLKDYEKSNDYLYKALALARGSKRTKEVIFIEIALASNHAFLNQQNDAITLATQANDRAEALGDTAVIYLAYASMTHVYYMLGQVDKAKSYLYKSEEMLKDYGEPEQLSATYNNLAVLFRIEGELEQAIAYNTKSLKISIHEGDRASQAKSYNNIGMVYRDQEAYDQAKHFFERAIALNDTLEIANSNPYQNLASVHRLEGDLDKEEMVLMKALEVEKESGRLETQKKIYQSLMKNAMKQNHPDLLPYQQEVERIDATIQQQQVDEKLEFIEAQKTILENELKWEREAQKVRTYRWIAFSAFLLIAAIAVIFLQQRNQQYLMTQQIKSNLENKVLRSQMNPHFVFNTLTIIQNSIVNNNVLQAASSISKFSKLIRQIFNLTQKDTVSLKLDLDVLQNYVDTQLMRFNNGFDYDVHLDLIDALEEIEVPPMLLQPFIENAIEHGIKNIDRRGQINVYMEQLQPNKLSIMVRDNGKGYNEQNQEDLHATDIVKARLKLNSQRDLESFYIRSSAAVYGTEVGFVLTINCKDE